MTALHDREVAAQCVQAARPHLVLRHAALFFFVHCLALADVPLGVDCSMFLALWSPVSQHRRPSWAAQRRPLLLVRLRCSLCLRLGAIGRALLVELLHVLHGLLHAGRRLRDVDGGAGIEQ